MGWDGMGLGLFGRCSVFDVGKGGFHRWYVIGILGISIWMLVEGGGDWEGCGGILMKWVVVV